MLRSEFNILQTISLTLFILYSLIGSLKTLLLIIFLILLKLFTFPLIIIEFPFSIVSGLSVASRKIKQGLLSIEDQLNCATICN